MFLKHPAISAEVLRFISPKVARALREASNNLTDLGIRHAVCGGVAVGAYGHIRATKDVDFLVGDEAFVFHGKLVSFAPGVTWAIDGIPTDMVPLETPDHPNQNMRFLESELDNPYSLDGLPIVSPEALVTMKLIAHRAQDLADISALFVSGATDLATCLKYLQQHQRFDLVAQLDRVILA